MTDVPPLSIAALLDAIVQLHQKLDQSIAAEPKNIGEGRSQLVMILRAFAEFLRAQRNLDDRLGPILFDLAAALLDLNEGVTADILLANESNGSGRNRDTTRQWLDRATVSIALTLLSRPGHMTKNSATEHIRRHHGWVDNLVSTQSAKPTEAIKRWEWMLGSAEWLARHPANHIQMASEIYRHGLEVFDTLAGQDFSTAALVAYVDRLLNAHRRS